MDDLELGKLIAHARRAMPFNNVVQVLCNALEVRLRKGSGDVTPGGASTPRDVTSLQARIVELEKALVAAGSKARDQTRKRMRKLRHRKRMVRAEIEDAAEAAERDMLQHGQAK